MYKLSIPSEPADPFGLDNLRYQVNMAKLHGMNASSLKDCARYTASFITPKKYLTAIVEIGYLARYQPGFREASQLKLVNSLVSLIASIPEIGSIFALELGIHYRSLKLDYEPLATLARGFSAPGSKPLTRFAGVSILSELGLLDEAKNSVKEIVRDFPYWAEPRLLIPRKLVLEAMPVDPSVPLTDSLHDAIHDVLTCVRETEMHPSAAHAVCMDFAVIALRGSPALIVEYAHEAAKQRSGNRLTANLHLTLFDKQSLLLFSYGHFLQNHLEECKLALSQWKSVAESVNPSLQSIEDSIARSSRGPEFQLFRQSA